MIKEDQAFSLAYYLAPPPPPSTSPGSKLSLFLTLAVSLVGLTDGRRGVGKEPNYTRARQPGPL
jgi:hypothetical protein